jgi:hypothetical protein
MEPFSIYSMARHGAAVQPAQDSAQVRIEPASSRARLRQKKSPSYMAARKHRHGVLAYVKRRHDMAAMKRRHGVLGHKA